MKLLKLLLPLVLTSTVASAASLSGTVTNGTTGKPAVGDEVILIKLQESMQEEARTKTDPQGHFTLAVADDTVPHLVRVIHDKVLYHQPAPPGTSKTDVQVFDAAPKLAGVTGAIDLMRAQTDATGLEITEMYAIKNNSSPPRTQMSERSFEIYLPKTAAMDQAMAAGPGGMPVRSAPVPLPDKGHYAFIFPLRPGETRFQLSYHMPYSGSADFSPRLTVPMENVGIMLPRSMQFVPAKPGSFESLVDENGVTVEVVKNVAAGAVPAFRVTGTGTMPRDAQDQNGAEPGANGNAGAAVPAANSRPGGGLGNPEATPDPLENYRWYILGLLVLVLAAGAFWATNHRQSAPLVASATAANAPSFAPPSSTTNDPEPRRVGSMGAPSFAPPNSSSLEDSPARRVGNHSALLLEALKEELFQLETERLQKKISDDEYAKAKAALDETLGRAMRRKS